ncbi:cyclic nucleotide-binding domain-containing protein [Spirulina subsalsa FACHB-351]|uniref:Cyclic nucleotide-binding domain-containing protein n=1 Tax=Spirulina subsalsa FACHB-351 TaxID=234711 RepID=A0ABT3L333_9CYAN|nr:cyclic nucleotide-binding domain-containing protein [Spirulina subsalsa]MCW6035395.1 cyclic nucleotide-binding domain-containing protein [Spirulina subsalsa FACHB-351]
MISNISSELPKPTPEDIQDCINWLSFHRIWGKLGENTIAQIAASLSLLPVEANTNIFAQNTTPEGLYLLKWGTVEIYRNSPVGKTHITYRNAGELFGHISLGMVEETPGYRTGAMAIAKSEVWFLSRDRFEQLKTEYPEINGVINTLLVQDLAKFQDRIAKEQARIQGLQPYIRPVPTSETIISNSKPSQKLVQQVELAAQDLKPIFVQALPGSGKTFIAGIIHAQSGLKNRPFAEIDCAQLPRNAEGDINTDILFGRIDGVTGAIALLERGTLAIDNWQILSPSDRDRLIHYLKTGNLIPNAPLEIQPNISPQSLWVRLILISPTKLPISGIDAHTLKLFTLSQRKSDISAFAQYFLERFCREQNRPTLQLDQADLRRLLSYDYPGNIAELENILKRAVVMTPAEQSVIPEQVLWSVESKKNAFRVDLLNQIPGLRQFLLSNWWPEGFWWPMMAIFVPVTIMGLIGPQTRDANIVLNLFWAWWWPFYLLLFVLIGRLWCAVCPFMITGEWIRKLSLWIWPRQLLPWPTKWLNKWGAWVLWGGFVAIYLWEKLWDLPHHANLSAALLIIITAGAVICSIIYERRLWCRYLCPIGGMNGMFAKLAVVELRSTQQVCGTQCSTFGCYQGSDATPVNFPDALPTEGQATGGCPLYSHPAQLLDNRDCTLCMTCVKACPNRSGQLNLRFPAADLVENHKGFLAEIALLLLLFGGVFLHYSQQILAKFGWKNIVITSDHLVSGIPLALLFLSIPLVLTYITHQIARFFDPEMPSYQTVIYAYLPIVLAGNLAYYVPAAMTEAGQILPIIARTFGFSGDGLITLTWSLDVAQFIQGLTLLLALGFSLFPLLKITRRPLAQNIPHILLMATLVAVWFQLMI